MIPLVVVLGLMAMSLVGAAAARRQAVKLTLTPGLSSLSVTPGQQVFLVPPPGGAWQLVAMIVNNSALQLPYAPPAGPVSVTVPPAVASVAASWSLHGASQGAVLLLVPPGANGATVITDPTAVAFAQAELALIASKGTDATITYGLSGSSQTFPLGLQAFQVWANKNVLASVGVLLRTDGQLDYATFSLLVSRASGF